MLKQLPEEKKRRQRRKRRREGRKVKKKRKKREQQKEKARINADKVRINAKRREDECFLRRTLDRRRKNAGVCVQGRRRERESKWRCWAQEGHSCYSCAQQALG